jgi:hypothetical protein
LRIKHRGKRSDMVVRYGDERGKNAQTRVGRI